MNLLAWRGRREVLEEHLLVLDWRLLCDSARELSRNATVTSSMRACATLCETCSRCETLVLCVQ